MVNKNLHDDDRIAKALEFSYKAHKGTYRKGTNIPYIVHPLDVASILMKNNAPEHVVIAGLLHDVVEDEDYTVSDIRNMFGEEVAELVHGASEPEELVNAEEGKKKNWPERKAHTVDFIRNANHDMKLLSCADKLANIRDIINDHERQGESFWNKFNATRDDQAWYYNSMIESIAFGDELITDMPAFKEFKKCVEGIFYEHDP